MMEGKAPGIAPDAGAYAPRAPSFDMGAAVLGPYTANSDLAACLLPLLTALGWHGHPRHIAEALPHFSDTLDITSFRNVMADLRYSSRPMQLSQDQVDPRLFPCLFLPDDGAAVVLLRADSDGVFLFDGQTGVVRHIAFDPRPGTAYFFSPAEDAEWQTQRRAQVGWFRTVLERFRGMVGQAFLTTLALNLLALAAPLYVMTVYDKVVSSGSREMLAFFTFGVLIVLFSDAMLRNVRARMVAFLGARLEFIVGNAVFQRLLYLPAGFTERATIGAQIARIKDFEVVRDFFTGPLATVLFELPFFFLYVVLLGIIGGVLAWIPLLAILLFFVLGTLSAPAMRASVSLAGRAGSRRNEFVIETLGKMRVLKFLGAERLWVERYRDVSAKAAMASFRNAQLSARIAVYSQAIVVGSGLTALAVGVEQVFVNKMTVGALIAGMILVWRVLSPIQVAFLALARVEQIRTSIRQINALMNLKPERDPNVMVSPLRRLRGRVSFSRVSLRYTSDADPALVGVTFDVAPGEVVAVIGRNGSGKSTMLKLLAGLYLPQAGSIRIDGMDIRQVDPIELRHAIAYVPQICHLFFGTIAQNLRLAQPTATHEDLEMACQTAEVWDDIQKLPQGLETRVGDGRSEQISASMMQRLALARAYLKQASIVLFDEPVNGLDMQGDQAFVRAIERMRGKATVFVVTHRPSHIRLADGILLFDGGYLRLSGPAKDVLPKIPKDLL